MDQESLSRLHETLSPRVHLLGGQDRVKTIHEKAGATETATDQLPDNLPPFSEESDPFHDDWPFWQKPFPDT